MTFGNTAHDGPGMAVTTVPWPGATTDSLRAVDAMAASGGRLLLVDPGGEMPGVAVVRFASILLDRYVGEARVACVSGLDAGGAWTELDYGFSRFAGGRWTLVGSAQWSALRGAVATWPPTPTQQQLVRARFAGLGAGSVLVERWLTEPSAALDLLAWASVSMAVLSRVAAVPRASTGPTGALWGPSVCEANESLDVVVAAVAAKGVSPDRVHVPGVERWQGQRDLGWYHYRPGSVSAEGLIEEGARIVARHPDTAGEPGGPPRMAPESERRVAASRHLFGSWPSDAGPADVWSPSVWSEATHHPGLVLRANDVFLDRGSAHPHEVWSVFDTDRLWMWTREPLRYPRFEPGHQVVRHERFATCGLTSYPWAVGHFPGEVLPRLMRLHDCVEPDVPLVWPAGWPERILAELRAAGCLEDRPVVVGVPGAYLVGGEVTWTHYEVHPSDLVDTRDTLRESFGGADGGPDVLVVDRDPSIARTLANHQAMVDAVTRTVPDASVRSVSLDGMAFLDILRLFAGARVVVAAHGAGLANTLACSPGTAVVEIGFVDPAFALPDMFFRQSHMLGLHHWLVVADGSYGGALNPSPGEVAAVVAEAMGR